LEKVETSTKAPEAGAVAEVLEVQGCHHQWIIDSPNGPSSRGECRLCGQEKEFLNYIEGSAWGYDVSVEQMSGSRMPTKTEMQGGGSVDGDD
jgi:hypothetical protein